MKEKTRIKFNVVAIIAIIIFCVAIVPITLQNDTYYTIAIGEHIMENGIDMKDPFSWHENLDYTYPHWAYDVMIYLIYQIGGQVGIYISTIVFACILGILIYVTNVKLNKKQITSFLITLGAMYLMRSYIAARAQLVTFILFVLEIYFIERYIENQKKRYILGLLLIPIAIANLHLAVWPFYFVLFLPYIGEYIISILADTDILVCKLLIKHNEKKIARIKVSENKIEKYKSNIIKCEDYLKKSAIKKERIRSNPYRIIVEKNKAVKVLIIIFVVCLFTGLLTPLGFTPYTYLYNTMQGNTTQNISEHLPLTLVQDQYFACTLILFLVILIFTDTKLRLKDFFMLAGLVFLSFYSRRQISMYVIICAYILNRLICAIFDKYDPKGCENVEKFSVTFLGKILVICIILLIDIAIIRPKIQDKFISEASYPVQASDYILENLDIDNIKLYNEYNFGSYLLFRGIPVFIDSRADLYSPEFNEGTYVFTDFLNISSLNLDYEDKFEEYEITHIITYKNSKLNLFIRKEAKYKLLYEDDYFVIYQR